MKLTNKLGLPEPIVEAISNTSYSKGDSDFTATGIIEPIQIQILKKRYADQLEEDASDLMYSLQGQVIHGVLERAAESLSKKGNTDYKFERRFYLRIDGMLVSAQVDLFQLSTGLLQDYKYTSVYQVKGELKEEYAKQTNIQAFLLRNGYEIVNGKHHYHKYRVRSIEIVAILRDWSKNKALSELGYPAHQWAIIPVPQIPDETVLAYLREQIRQNKEADCLKDNQLPPCSKQERWAKDDTYAVMKKGQKKAVKLCYSESAAQMHIDSLGGTGYNIILRSGENTRCKSYCPVAKFCNQYKEIKKGETDNE